MNFWDNLVPAAFALAPMEDVTDTVFREVVMLASAPSKLHLLFTEFTSVDGLCHTTGRKAVMHRLLVNPSEDLLLKKNNIKLIAQIWGNDPEKFYKASRLIADEFHFDGIDINMGCPAKKVIRQNSCSALIDQPGLALEIIDAVVRGSGLPVSVKTRTGTQHHRTEHWIGLLLRSGLSAITLHARTQRMLSLYPADWDQVSIAVQVRDRDNPDVKILGNGDIQSYNHGLEMIEATGADGVMVGRGIFGNLWFFDDDQAHKSLKDNLHLLKRHIQLYDETWGKSKNFNILNRFFKVYIHGFEGSSALRTSLMEARNAAEASGFLENYMKMYCI